MKFRPALALILSACVLCGAAFYHHFADQPGWSGILWLDQNLPLASLFVGLLAGVPAAGILRIAVGKVIVEQRDREQAKTLVTVSRSYHTLERRLGFVTLAVLGPWALIWGLVNCVEILLTPGGWEASSEKLQGDAIIRTFFGSVMCLVALLIHFFNPRTERSD